MAVWNTHGPTSSCRAIIAQPPRSKIPLVSVQSIRACVNASKRCQQPLLQACRGHLLLPTSLSCSVAVNMNLIRPRHSLDRGSSISKARSEACIPQASFGQSSTFDQSTSCPSRRFSTPHVRLDPANSDNKFHRLASRSYNPAHTSELSKTLLPQIHASSSAHLRSKPILRSRHSVRCCCSTSSSNVMTALGVPQQPAAAPLDWSVVVNGWRIRTFTAEDLPQVGVHPFLNLLIRT